MAIIDIGSPAINRADSAVFNYTYVNRANPANVSGKITSIEIWAKVNMGGVEVATFSANNNVLTTRDTQAIGNVTAGSKQTFEVDLDVQEGDLIGIYFASGEIERDTIGFGGLRFRNSDEIPCTDEIFNTLSGDTVSLYATGITIITTQNPTDILTTSATGNGNITELVGGGNATVRGFKYGLTKAPTFDVHDNGDFGLGAFTKGLTELGSNTTYWIRAYYTNNVGTFYGDWNEFQTTTAGTIPTGTALFVCADLSGYSFQLMRSETDDGETYTAYFTISTDLTNKQGLAFYKRILDLHLYFMSEDSGMATIYVKRDSEAEWQTVGSVSLAGSTDIIIPHLAPDIRAKHFLFKISASNMFRFLGVLFEYLPEDLR